MDEVERGWVHTLFYRFAPADMASTDTIPNASVAFDVVREMEAKGNTNPNSLWFKQPVISTRFASSCAVMK